MPPVEWKPTSPPMACVAMHAYLSPVEPGTLQTPNALPAGITTGPGTGTITSQLGMGPPPQEFPPPSAPPPTSLISHSALCSE